MKNVALALSSKMENEEEELAAAAEAAAEAAEKKAKTDSQTDLRIRKQSKKKPSAEMTHPKIDFDLLGTTPASKSAAGALAIQTSPKRASTGGVAVSHITSPAGGGGVRKKPVAIDFES